MKCDNQLVEMSFLSIELVSKLFIQVKNSFENLQPSQVTNNRLYRGFNRLFFPLLRKTLFSFKKIELALCNGLGMIFYKISKHPRLSLIQKQHNINIETFNTNLNHQSFHALHLWHVGMHTNTISYSGGFPIEYDIELIDHVGSLESLNGIDVKMTTIVRKSWLKTWREKPR